MRVLYTIINYKYALYRSVNDTKTIVNGAADSDIQAKNQNQKTITAVVGKYKFTAPDSVIVAVNYWGITAYVTYVVEVPEVELFVKDSTGSVYVDSAGIMDVGSEFVFCSVT